MSAAKPTTSSNACTYRPRDHLYKTVAQIAEEFEQDTNTGCGFGLMAQWAARDEEIHKWASLSEEDLRKIAMKPKIEEGTW